MTAKKLTVFMRYICFIVVKASVLTQKRKNPNDIEFVWIGLDWINVLVVCLCTLLHFNDSILSLCSSYTFFIIQKSSFILNFSIEYWTHETVFFLIQTTYTHIYICVYVCLWVSIWMHIGELNACNTYIHTYTHKYVV